MAKIVDLVVPNIGNFKSVEIIEVLIKENQNIKKNDGIITLESDKSSVEVPSQFSGKIKNIKVKVDLPTTTLNIKSKNSKQLNITILVLFILFSCYFLYSCKYGKSIETEPVPYSLIYNLKG